MKSGGISILDSFMPKEWLRTATNPNTERALGEFSNQYTFYEIKAEGQYVDIRRQTRDHEDDMINMVRQVYRTIKGIGQGAHHFD
jgi:hypothetical protein